MHKQRAIVLVAVVFDDYDDEVSFSHSFATPFYCFTTSRNQKNVFAAVTEYT